jgi:hypothetical protein
MTTAATGIAIIPATATIAVIGIAITPATATIAVTAMTGPATTAHPI